MILRIFKNLYFLTFLNGFLLSSLLFFKMEAAYENELFYAIQKNINKKIDFNDTQDSLVIKIMQTCNSLLGNRVSVFTESDDLDGVKVNYIHPATIDLMTAKGACGSYSLVLARILRNYNLPVRIGQMKANGIFGAHNIVEVKTKTKWIVLDPTFDMYFVTPDNKLASFEEIKNNWDYYSKQVSKEYNPVYRYEDVRYTNWQKIPVMMPAIKKMLDVLIGRKKADSICIRAYFLRMYDVCFYAILILFIAVFWLTIRKLVKTRLFPNYNIPFTPSNIIKYLKLRRINPAAENTVKS